MSKFYKGLFVVLIVFILCFFCENTEASSTYFMWIKTEIKMPVYSSLEEYKDDFVLEFYLNGELSNDYYVEYETNCSTFTTVMTNKVGRYTVYYKAYSKNNNISSEQAITFIVIDITAPDIEIISDVIEINCGSNLSNLSWYTIVDDTCKDSEIIIKLDDSSVLYNHLGTYPACITATDKYGNTTLEEFIVKVIDESPPNVLIIKPLVFNYNEEIVIGDYIKCNDNCDGDVTRLMRINGLDLTKLGRFDIVVEATDYSDNTITLNFTIDVVDMLCPTINLIEEECVLDVREFEIYDEEYFKKYIYNITDNYSQTNNITLEIDTSCLMEKIEDFPIYFIAIDEFNNKTKISFLVKMREFIGPVIDGPEEVSIILGEYIDLYSLVTVSDLYDNEVLDRLIIDDGGFNPTVSGRYIVTYTSFNTSGIYTEKVIVIDVLDENSKENVSIIPILIGGAIFLVVTTTAIIIIIKKRKH